MPPPAAGRAAEVRAGRSPIDAFLCHPLLYTSADGAPFTAPDALPYTRVLGVQESPVPSEHYPNKATAWARANHSHVCAANVALYSGGELLTIDLLLRNLGAPSLGKDAQHFTAVFILFSGGSRALYNRALRYVRRVRVVAAREYAFFPSFLLLHITGGGLLRRKWL